MMILFLDIDNVLMRPFDSRISLTAKAALDDARKRGFTFVLHSTWRVGMLEDAERLFREVGHTFDDYTDPDEPGKQKAILGWLDDRYAGDEWPKTIVVVDDHEIAPIHGVRIVRIDPKLGLRVGDF